MHNFSKNLKKSKANEINVVINLTKKFYHNLSKSMVVLNLAYVYRPCIHRMAP